MAHPPWRKLTKVKGVCNEKAPTRTWQQICLSCADKSTGREAETQQIGVRQPLYCVRHPDRDLGRLRRIPHLHLGARAVVIAATFTVKLRTWHPFCPPAFKKSCAVAIEPGWSRQGCPRRGSSTASAKQRVQRQVYSRMLAGLPTPIFSRPLASEKEGAQGYRHTSGWGSGLEAFSHNPSEGRFAPPADRPSTSPQYLITQFLSY